MMYIITIVVFIAAIFISFKIIQTNKIFNYHNPVTNEDSRSWWERKSHISLFKFTKEVLGVTDYKHHWSVFIIRTFVWSFSIGLLAAMSLKSIITFILIFTISVLIAYHKRIEAYNDALTKFDEDFLALLEAFTIHYRDYGNINRAITSMVADLDNSMRYPSQILANSLEAGEPIEKALERFYLVTKNRWARAYGSLILANYYHGGDIVVAFRDFMGRVKSAMGYLERKKASQSYTITALYIGIGTQPLLLGISMFITQGFSDVLFHTDFGISVLNTVLLVDIVCYSIIRSVQRRGLQSAY